MRSLLLTVCSLAIAFSAFAQSDRGTITGTISDPAGAIIAGAAIEAKNVNTSTLDDLPILTLSGSAAGIGTANTLGNIRNPLSSVGLLPGARITTDSVMRINGMPSNSQSINIEGQDATNGFFKQQNQISQAGMDAIQEVAIQTSNFAAEYGQAGGGYFNYTMKSGTNTLHGSAYDYFVNEALNAGSPFTDAGTTNKNKIGQHVRNPLRQSDYGFTLGG